MSSERLGLLLPSRDVEKTVATDLRALDVNVMYARSWSELVDGFHQQALSLAVVHETRLSNAFRCLEEAQERRTTVFLFLVAPSFSEERSLRWIRRGGYCVLNEATETGVLRRKLAPLLSLLGNRNFLMQTHRSLSQKLRQESDRLAEQAHRDPQTDLLREEQFYQSLSRLTGDHQAAGEPLSLMELSLDDPERIRDQHGESGLDDLVKAIADILHDETLDKHRLGRLDESHFGVISPRADQHTTQSLGQRIRDRLRNHNKFQNYLNGEEPPTLSCGIASVPRHASSDEELRKLVETSHDKARERGGDRIVRTINEEFQYAPGADEEPDSVHLTGDFLDWDQPGVALNREGNQFKGEVAVPEGILRYAFVIDGSGLIPDPGADEVPEGPNDQPISRRTISAPSTRPRDSG